LQKKIGHYRDQTETLRKKKGDALSREQETKQQFSVLIKEMEDATERFDNVRNEVQTINLEITVLEEESRTLFNEIVDLKVKLLNCKLDNLLLLILGAMDGYNVSVLFYGESGSGKTFTMLGNRSDLGILPQTLTFLFRLQDSSRANSWKFSISIFCYEIYNENFYDLLNHKRICAPLLVTSAQHVCSLNATFYLFFQGLDIIQFISDHRITTSTALNSRSSRSHCILCIKIFAENLNQHKRRSSVLMFADLAGSERVENLRAVGTRMKEAKHINQSLLSLRSVLRDQRKKEPIIRYRDSKLTMALSSCLGAADSKTFLVVTLSPHCQSFGETMRSLVFASEVCFFFSYLLVTNHYFTEKFTSYFDEYRYLIQPLNLRK
uniref:Kinesin motor domain-containing protein n=1 Tax=Enterobius vermicularis TaxID=51028 RepID=A0A0N4VEV6_ENTVE